MHSPFIGGDFRITSPYGTRTLNGTQSFHAGLDAVGISSKRVCAVASGTVAVSQIVTDRNDPTWEWGNYVAVIGDDGKIIYYCHLSERSVRAGKRVEMGDEIGIEGNTGYSFGAHLHLEVRHAGSTINAAEYIGVSNEIGTYNANVVLDNTPAEWSRESVEWAIANGILQGDTNGNYSLRAPCTREQMCAFLYRTYNLIRKEI